MIETNNIILTKELIKNSARNSLLGKISSINKDGINSNITIKYRHNDTIHSKTTSSSCSNLELQIDDEIYVSSKVYNITII